MASLFVFISQMKCAVAPNKISQERNMSREVPMSSDLTLLDARAVCQLLGISRATLWRLRQLRDFPLPIRLSTRRIAWRRDAIGAWLEARERAGTS
jgi:predicted DNA-binding transcriptional regulator AlpA